jgi:DNA-binding transcriptional regulator YdaS (Cro superfamily)
MNLKQYLDGLDRDERESFAKRCRVQYVYLTQLVSGFRKPSPKLAKAIYRESGGAVPLSVLRPDIWAPSGVTNNATNFRLRKVTAQQANVK